MAGSLYLPRLQTCCLCFLCLQGSAEEAGAARRALLSVDQGGAPQEELPESSGSASGVHPGSSGAGPDDDVPGSIAIGLQQRTKSYEVASPRDKEEVKAMLREALSDRSVQDNSKRWWKKLADNHAPIRVLLVSHALHANWLQAVS